MAAMRSPEGDEFDILPAGVQALIHLGWELLEPFDEEPGLEPAPEPEPTPAPEPRRRTPRK